MPQIDYDLERKSWRPPTPKVDADQLFKWASQGLTRQMMARKLGVSETYFNTSVRNSKELTIAELRGKIKFYE